MIGEKISKNSENGIGSDSFNFFWTNMNTTTCVISLIPNIAATRGQGKEKERSRTNEI